MAELSTITTEQSERAHRLIDLYEEELIALLSYCNSRQTREEGVPAILILDDFTRADKPSMHPRLGDEALKSFYADLAIALALLVESTGGDPYYPSICPAMSAIAEQAFSLLPFTAWKTGMEAG